MRTRFVWLPVAVAALCQAQSSITAVSSASYQTPVAPASLVSIFGSNLSANAVQAQLDSSGQLPTELSGVSVQVAGQPAQLLYVSPTQINIVMPAAISSGTVTLVVQPGGSQTNVEVRTTAPALFSLDTSGSGPGAILNAVTFTGGPFLVETARNLGDDKRTRLALYGTGIRYAGNPFLDPTVTNAAASVSVQAKDIAGNFYDLPVEYAGAAPTWFGLDQVNVVLPPQLDGIGQLSLTVAAGGSTSNVVTTVVNALPDASVRLVGLSLAQSTVMAGGSIGGTVTLNAPARSGGFVVSLASSSAFVQTPGTVTVAAGQVYADFIIQTNSTGAGSASVTASANGVSRSALLIINSTSGPSLLSLVLTQASVSGGTSVTGTVTLTGTAPSGGAVVQLSASQTGAQPPATVTVPFGQTTVTFTLPTIAVASAQTVTITAAYAGASVSTTLTVNPLFTFTLDNQAITGGQTANATVTLGSPAPVSGALVRLASSDLSTARIASMLSISSGQTSVTTPVTTIATSAARTVTLSAIYSSVTEQVQLTVNPPGAAVLNGLALSSSAVKGGTSVTGTVTLSAAAGSTGVTVTLQTSSRLTAQVPGSVIVPNGQTKAQFTITTGAVAAAQNVTISATAGGITKTAALIVQ